ncbi:MAG: MtrB/PioB family decaheme-associated outer membrane protein [Magnetococcales bacterium]|nr:MtrB/PioB family decaheme-associated outer membrane protein [Magnetococcales bacterium]
MRKINKVLTWGACAAVVCSASAAVWAGEEPTEKPANPWNMSPTAAPFTTPDSSVTYGLGYLHGDRQQLGQFDKQDHTRGSLLLDANIRQRDEATGLWSQYSARNLGLDNNREATVVFEKQGLWGLTLDYAETPFKAPYSVNSSTVGLGTPQQIIPKAATAGTGSIQPIDTSRDRFAVNTFRTWNRKVKFNLNFRNETKEGTRQWGRGSANEFVLEPVDWTMRQLEPTVGYMGRDLQLSGGYNGSWFRNENNMVDTLLKGDNPSTLANHTYLTLPLSNEAHKVFLDGGYHFTPDTRGTFKVAYTRAMQNEYLPTKGIAGLSNASAPDKTYGRLDTTLLHLGLTTKPLPELSVHTKLRYFSEADKTPIWMTVQTPTTQVHTTETSLSTTTGLIEGTYRLPFQTSLMGSVEQKMQKRHIPFGSDLNSDGFDDERYVPWRSDLDETTYKLQLRRNLSETINGSLGIEHANRTGSQLTDSKKIMGTAQGKISPFFIADRDRDKLRLAMDWRPVDRLGLQLLAENALERYPDQSPFGQQKGSAQLYSLDLDYAPTDKWLLTAWYSYDINRTWQGSGRWSASNAHEVDKSSFLEDVGSALGLGARHQWDDKLKLGGSFQFTRAKSSYEDTVTRDATFTGLAYPVEVTPLPEIVTPMSRFNLFAEYKGLGPGLLRFDYIHEQWRTNDWTWKFSDGTPYIFGTTTDSTKITTQDSQTADFIGIRYTTYFNGM